MRAEKLNAATKNVVIVFCCSAFFGPSDEFLWVKYSVINKLLSPFSCSALRKWFQEQWTRIMTTLNWRIKRFVQCSFCVKFEFYNYYYPCLAYFTKSRVWISILEELSELNEIILFVSFIDQFRSNRIELNHSKNIIFIVT